MADNWVKQEGAGMWLPENEGDELIGSVVKVDEGSYGLQYTIKKDNGDEVRTPSHKVLQNRLVGTKVSERVKIVFVKEEPPSVKGQNPTKIYEVFKAK
jgi:hypothetical protein